MRPIYDGGIYIREEAIWAVNKLKALAKKLADLFLLTLLRLSLLIEKSKTIAAGVRLVGTALVLVLWIALCGYLAYRTLNSPMRLLRWFLREVNVPLPSSKDEPE